MHDLQELAVIMNIIASCTIIGSHMRKLLLLTLRKTAKVGRAVAAQEYTPEKQQ